MRETSIKYTLDLQEFISSVKSIPGITDKQLDKMVRTWTRRNNQVTKEMAKAAKEAEKAAAAAAKAHEDAALKTRRAWDATKKVLEGVGGPLGELAGRAQNFGEGLSSAAGAAGVAAAAVTVLGIATARAVAEVWRFADAAKESLATLEEMNLVSTLPPEAVARIREWESASEAMRVAAMQAHVEIASLLTPTMTRLADATLGARNALNLLRDGLGDTAGSWIQGTIDQMDLLVVALESQGVAGHALSTVYRMLAAQQGELRREEAERVRVLREIEEVSKSVAVYGPAWDPVADAAYRAAQAEKALAEARREAERLARTQLSAEAMLYELRSDTLTAEQRAIDAAERRAAQLDELAAAGADAATIEQARLENTRQLTEDLAAIERQRHEEARRQELETMALIEQLSQRRLELAAQEAAAEQAAQQQIRDANAQSALAILGQIDQVAGAYIGSREAMTEAERRAVMLAFRVQQAAGIAQSVIHGAMAFGQAMANLPPPASYIAAGAAAGAVATQGIVIAAAKPPEFPTGGLVTAASLGLSADHGLVGVQAGEGIVSRRGMAALGEQGLAAVNRGEAPAERLEVVMQYRHRPMDRLMYDHVRRPGALTDALDRGRTIGHRER